jgi:hypothetical protein
MISHDNLTWTASNIIENYVDMNHEDRVMYVLLAGSN